MAAVVIPFAGVEGKTRLHTSRPVRRALSLAMLGDVLAAATASGDTHVVTTDPEAAAVARELGARAIADPGGGQGPAVAGVLARLREGPVLVVNADLPCALPIDLGALLAATPGGGLALVEALDGTTNALGIAGPELFAPLYGRDSADRFRAHARELGFEAVTAEIPNLAEDVDTRQDLERLQLRCGPRTQRVLADLPAKALS
jgi:2-phospho-L-lactate guanylyltransferase